MFLVSEAFLLAAIGPGVLLGFGDFLFLSGLCGFLLVTLFPRSVLAIVAWEVLNMAISREDKRMVHRAVHEETVMTHDDDTAVELRQIFLKDLQRGDVQVVGRLIEDEEIGLGHQYHSQIEPAPFTTAQLGNELLLVLGCEQEMVEPCHGCVVVFLVKVDVLCHVTHGINHALAFIKVHSLLTVVGKFHRFANLKVAAVGLDDVKQQFDKGGLAHTVVAHNT